MFITPSLNKKINLKTLTLVLLFSTLLYGCKYVEFYRFSKQFCDIDEYIELSQNNKSTNVIFNTPILSRELLLRYLGALPVHSQNALNLGGGDFIARDDFLIELIDDSEKQFEFSLSYHELSNTELLQGATLDPNLSHLFDPEMIRALMHSFCTDDYDIEDEFVDLRFQLSDISKDWLPTHADIIKTFGDAAKNSTSPAIENKAVNGPAALLSYTLRFSKSSIKTEALATETLKHEAMSDKLIHFTFGFDAQQSLQKLAIQYYRYDYALDFESGAGRLLVDR